MKEYAIMQRNRPGLHRGPYSERSTAEDWIQECLDEGFREGVFFIISRETSDWRVDSADGLG